MSRVVHFEVHASDPQRAIKFYESVFKWKFTAWGGQDEYWLIETGPRDEPGIDGGLFRRRGEIDGEAVIAYVCTIDVKSIDKTIGLVQTHGGTVVVPRAAIPGVGWLVYFKDTEGNIFGAMQADTSAS